METYDNRRLLETITVLFTILYNYLFLEIAVSIFDLFYLKTLQSQGTVSGELQKYWQIKSAVIKYVSWLLPLFTGIVFITWLYREYWNLQKRYYQYSFRYKPIGAILAFIVPVFNLYAPYYIIREISVGYENYYRKTINVNYIKVWWFSFLAYSIYVRIILFLHPGTIDELIVINYHAIFATMLGIVSLRFLIIILKELKIN